MSFAFVLAKLTKENNDLQGRAMDWQNAYYRVTNEYDKVTTKYENLEHKFDKEKQLRKDGEVQLVDLMEKLRA